MFKDKLSVVIEKFYRYSMNTVENLNIIDESDFLDDIDSAVIKPIDLTWFIPYLDGLIETNDSKMKTDLLVMEELIYICCTTEFIEEDPDDWLGTFDNGLYKNMSYNGFEYSRTNKFNSNKLVELVNNLVGYGIGSDMLILGWITGNTPILATMDI